jgi:hypothetical protein
MFKLMGVLTNCLKGTVVKAVEVIDVNLDSCLAISRTGNKYALQFETDAGKLCGLLHLIANM